METTSISSFSCDINLPRNEKDFYLKENLGSESSNENKIINLVFKDEGNNLSLPLNPETTIKEALQIFIKKYKSNDNIEDFDFQFNSSRLDINSEEKIGDKFGDKSTITVLEVKELIAG